MRTNSQYYKNKAIITEITSQFWISYNNLKKKKLFVSHDLWDEVVVYEKIHARTR